jgi:hypothetical protein
MRIFTLNEDQVDNIAAMNLVTAVCLAFFGISFGSWITLHATIIPLEGLKDQQAMLSRLTTECMASEILSVFFFVTFAIGLTVSVLKFIRIKRGSVKPISR